MMFARRLTAAAAAIALAAALTTAFAACSDDAPGDGGTDPGDGARLRVMHAAEGTGAVDLLVDGQRVAGGIAFSRSSEFEAVPAGTHTVEIRPTAGGAALATASVALDKDRPYTAVLSGGGASLDAVVTLDTASVPATGTIKLRIIHNAADAPPLDVFLTEATADLGGASPTIVPFRYGVGLDSAFPGYMQRDPGAWRVRLTDEGTKNVRLDTGPLDLAAGAVRTVILWQDPDEDIHLTVINER